jgi:5-dehydro-4-deoxyglucarate dehydratase
MQPGELAATLQGAIAFPVTPYASDGSVDLGAMRANAAWLPDAGACALTAPSGTGEMYALTPQECADVTRATVDAVGRRVPVVAGVGFNAAIGAELARQAERSGASGILILPPYYATPDSDGLLAYYREIAAATRLGVAVYARDGAAFTPESLEEVARDVPNFVAFKDGRGDVRLFQRLRAHVNAALGATRLVWLSGVGDDFVAPYFAAGAQGFTSSVACFWPEASAELFRLAASGDMKGVRAFHERVIHPIYELRQLRKGFEVSIMKACMELLGHKAGPVRPPLANVPDDVRAKLKRILEEIGAPTAASRADKRAADLKVGTTTVGATAK